MLTREEQMIADQDRETVEQALMRNDLYASLKTSREEPGMSLEKIARVIITALSREEARALAKQINDFLND